MVVDFKVLKFFIWCFQFCLTDVRCCANLQVLVDVCHLRLQFAGWAYLDCCLLMLGFISGGWFGYWCVRVGISCLQVWLIVWWACIVLWVAFGIYVGFCILDDRCLLITLIFSLHLFWLFIFACVVFSLFSFEFIVCMYLNCVIV